MQLAVCWKWGSAGDGDGDAGDEPDARWAGVSPADEAALEIALRIAERDDGAGDRTRVLVVSLGPPALDDTLRRALAVGADEIVRVDAPLDLNSDLVATALAEVVAGSDVVLCGDYSMDRGTGSVPAYLAAELGAAQALGLVEIDVDLSAGSTGRLRATRRLDGGRRELLEVPSPAVLSVEGSVATLRRASLTATLAARTAPVTAVPGPPGEPEAALVHPYRPRPRTIHTPHGPTLARVRDLLDVGGESPTHAEVVTLDPPAAAARIVDQLREWGYLDAGPPTDSSPSPSSV